MALAHTKRVAWRTWSVGWVAAALLSAGPALAINCNEGYQRVQGNAIATPFCQDEYLSQVARTYGVKSTGDLIRNNPNYKREVCRLVGRDIRVQTSCIEELSPGRSGR